VESAVVAAFVDDETGEVRTTRDAKAEFVAYMRSAQQAHREWADILMDEWDEKSAGNFALNLWKRQDAFTTTVSGVKRSRDLMRGTQRRSGEGTRADVQASLLDWTLDDIKQGIYAEAMRERESKVNRQTYIAL